MAVVAVLLVTAPASAATTTSKRCIDAAEHGQQARAEGKLIEASVAFEECSANECPTAVRRDCGRWVEELEAAIPTVIFKLEDAEGNDVHGGDVFVDDEPVRADEGRARRIDPGIHRVVWLRPPGGERIEREVVLREGETHRLVVLRAAPAARTGTPEARGSAARSPWPWALGSAGVVLAGTGAGLWIAGSSERRDLRDGCAPMHACAESDVDASRTKLVVGDILVGAGVIAIAAAVYFVLR
jgi:hypothetical protein